LRCKGTTFFENRNYLCAFSSFLVQFLCFSFLVGRFKPLNLQSAVQLAHEDVSSGSRMNR